MFLFGAASSFAQGDKFIIEGRLKVDGGSVSDAKIIVERDGRQVKSIEGESRFEIQLDFQSIYIISFVKEGFVTKRLRFDTNVPKDRIEYGFEPFGFQVEIFEQYDDVNMVVFNQPVGKISYSELIDEFDYDTDYTKSIQSQLDQAQDEVVQAKEKKEKEAAQNEKKIEELTDVASSQAKDGNYTAAVKSLEEAKKLTKDPAIQKQIDEYKKAEQEQKKQQQFEEVVKEAEAAMAAGDLDEAKRLFEQANSLIGGDKKVQSQLAKIEEEKAAEAKRLAEEAAAKEAADKAEAERLAAEQTKQVEEEAKRAEEDGAAAIELARKKEAFEAEKATAERLLKQNKLNDARVAYERALKYFPNDDEVKKRIAQIDELKQKLAQEKEKNRDAAVAITENRGKETEQLASIIAEEEKKSSVQEIAPGDVKMAQAVMEQDVRPGAVNSSPVIISDVKVGDAARQSRSAQMTEDEKYDGIVKRSEEQQKEKAEDDERDRLMANYRDRKTIETDSVDNTFVTRIFISNGRFVTTYKKVQHSWGGEYYFIDGRATNRRYWEHQTQ